jgi:hypothetical protein
MINLLEGLVGLLLISVCAVAFVGVPILINGMSAV